MLKRNLLFVVLCLTLFFLIPTTQAHAYLDPGSGSLIIQVVVAGLIGLMVTMRVFKESILSFLGFKRPSEDEDDDEQHTTESDNP